MPDDLMFRPAAELAALVRTGELAATDLVARSLERIEALDPEFNAFAEVDADRALAAAAEIGTGDSRPFAGVPIAIKNNRAVAGLRLTQGCRLMEDFVAPYDHNVVRRLRGAGFVVVGVTTLPEYGILPVTEAAIFGPTRNPWDAGRTPGGSSGGSAAAVAAGMVPIAHGNDGGGSIRIPAACCGLVGLKPSRNRNSAAPELGESALVTDGVLSRTVAETAALLDVLAGYETGDWSWAPPPPEPFAATAARPPGALRIAMATSPPLPDAPVDPACAAAAHRAADLLEDLGHSVSVVSPPWQIEGIGDLFGAYFAAHVSLGVHFSALIAGRGAPNAADMEPMSWALWEMSQNLTAVQFRLLETQLQQISRALVTFLDPYDALLTPALAQRPLPIGALDTAAAVPLDTFRTSGYFTPFTPIFNATGQPAVSLPLFQGDDGLPLGVQIVGRPAGEGPLLALAAQLEAAHPWAERRPLAR
ncbi:MAG: amidase [Solirubrobacteraceae bacterium]